jgi:hypothetical protein
MYFVNSSVRTGNQFFEYHFAIGGKNHWFLSFHTRRHAFPFSEHRHMLISSSVLVLCCPGHFFATMPSLFAGRFKGDRRPFTEILPNRLFQNFLGEASRLCACSRDEKSLTTNFAILYFQRPAI